MPTDYLGLSPDVIQAFEEASPLSEDPEVAAEIRALETLFGCPMPEEVSRVLETERSELFDPSPCELAELEHPFEALILRAQEMDDTAAVLFPLTGSIFLHGVGGVELLGHVTGTPGQPVMPFAGWRREMWAYDLPSFKALTSALKVFLYVEDDYGDDDDDDEDEYQEPRVGRQAEALLKPVWGRVQRTEWTENMFDAIDSTEVEDRLDEAASEVPDLRPQLTQWWRHERCLLLGFGLIGKFRPPETDAFAQVPWGALDHPHFLTNLGAQMNLLWRGWFLDEEDLLERTMAATEASPSRLVQDARRLISELLDGRTMIGSVDMQEARANYKTWIDDPSAYERAQRTKRRTALEGCLEPSPTGIELVRAQWPLHEAATNTKTAEPAGHTWDPQTRTLIVTNSDGPSTKVLAAPKESQSFGLTHPDAKTGLSPSGSRFACLASIVRLGPGGQAYPGVGLVEYDFATEAWRKISDADNLRYFAYVDEDRWVVHGNDYTYLLSDVDGEIKTGDPAFTGQPHTFHIPQLGVLIAYGKTDLVEGRDPGDLKSPWIRVYGTSRDRLSSIAGFPVDGVELVAKQTEGVWSVGLVSADREVAWELRNLEGGTEAWRQASEAGA